MTLTAFYTLGIMLLLIGLLIWFITTLTAPAIAREKAKTKPTYYDSQDFADTMQSRLAKLPTRSGLPYAIPANATKRSLKPESTPYAQRTVVGNTTDDITLPIVLAATFYDDIQQVHAAQQSSHHSSHDHSFGHSAGGSASSDWGSSHDSSSSSSYDSGSSSSSSDSGSSGGDSGSW